jgi:hypothetical protein
METFQFTLTTAGLDALVDAQNAETEAIQIAEIGLSDQLVSIAPTLVALPGEFKRLDTLSGISASETIIHMTASDSSTDVYDVRSVALYLADGTLFAAYSRAEGNVFRKVDIASFLFSIDVAFGEAVADTIVFGDATFVYPPATETVQGVAEIATQEETDDGLDDQRIVTPLKLAERLAPILQALIDEESARIAADGVLQGEITAEELARTNADAAINATIAALLARTITGAGLAAGGGDLSANRVLTVTPATPEQTVAMLLNTVALTPASLAGLFSTYPAGGGRVYRLGSIKLQTKSAAAAALGTTVITLPEPFNGDIDAWVNGGLSDGAAGNTVYVTATDPGTIAPAVAATVTIYNRVNDIVSATAFAIGPA